MFTAEGLAPLGQWSTFYVFMGLCLMPRFTWYQALVCLVLYVAVLLPLIARIRATPLTPRMMAILRLNGFDVEEGGDEDAESEGAGEGTRGRRTPGDVEEGPGLDEILQSYNAWMLHLLYMFLGLSLLPTTWYESMAGALFANLIVGESSFNDWQHGRLSANNNVWHSRGLSSGPGSMFWLFVFLGFSLLPIPWYQTVLGAFTTTVLAFMRYGLPWEDLGEGAAGEGGGGGGCGGGGCGCGQDLGTTRMRHEGLLKMTKDQRFDANRTACGRFGLSALPYALGGVVEGEGGFPIDEDAVKLALGIDGLDVNATDEEGQTFLFQQCLWGRSRNVELLLGDPRVDPNLEEPKGGMSPLAVAANLGHDRCVALLLADDRVDPNLAGAGPTADGVPSQTPLRQAVTMGRVGCVKLLLADKRVDPNRANAQDGYTPLNSAANAGMDRCVELLVADKRVDVCRADVTGETPLISACVELMKSMDQVGVAGSSDPTRSLVVLLKSRRISRNNLKKDIAFFRRFAAAGSHCVTESARKTSSFILPILEAQAKGEFRWCAHCYKLTPDVDLNRCGGCKQVGYCDHNSFDRSTPCHAAHWKAGHKQECKRFQAEARGGEVGSGRVGGSGGEGGGGGKTKKKTKKTKTTKTKEKTDKKGGGGE